MRSTLLLFAPMVQAITITYWKSTDCSGSPSESEVFPVDSCQLLPLSSKSFQLTDTDGNDEYIAGFTDSCDSNMNYINPSPIDHETGCIDFYDSQFISLIAKSSAAKRSSRIDRRLLASKDVARNDVKTRQDGPYVGQTLTFTVNGVPYTLRLSEYDAEDQSRGPDQDVIQATEEGVTQDAQAGEGTTQTALYYQNDDAYGRYMFDYQAANNHYASDVPTNDWRGILGEMFGIIAPGPGTPLSYLFELFTGEGAVAANEVGNIRWYNPM